MIYISEKSVFYVNQVYGPRGARASYSFDFFLSVSANVGSEHRKRDTLFRRVHLDDGKSFMVRQQNARSGHCGFSKGDPIGIGFSDDVAQILRD